MKSALGRTARALKTSTRALRQQRSCRVTHVYMRINIYIHKITNK